MILLFNVFLTKTAYKGFSRDYITYDRFDIFKYTLASYSVIPVNKSYFFIKIDDCYKDKENELRQFIEENFPNSQFFNYSLDSQMDWQKELSKIFSENDDELIMYNGNDDHVFIDYSLDFLNDGIKQLEQDNKDYILAYIMSHWVEVISTMYVSNSFRINNKTICYPLIETLATQIFNRKFFQFFFFDSILTDWSRRIDYLTKGFFPVCGLKYPLKIGTEIPPVRTYAPLSECVRHFDSYVHISVPLDICPRLYIPEGFFENNIKINCYEDYKPGYINFNPLNPLFRHQSFNYGCHEKRMEEDIPLFWRKRISEIKVNNNIDKSKILEYRNAYFKQLITSPHSRYHQFNAANVIGHGVLPLPEEIIKIGYRN